MFNEVDKYMIKKIFKIIKKVVIAGFLLYAYNMIMAPLNLLIPINIFTVIITAIFGILAIPFLVIILLFIF
ncbi:MAG: pro-sigmaK processing inhibitor BofA family protein [Bacilli bacterium]|nr:pro-sigmaK processing inhibitor BofA family protein [Bacilli bacterium]